MGLPGDTACYSRPVHPTIDRRKPDTGKNFGRFPVPGFKL